MNVVVALAALLSLCAPTRAQDAYPSKTITMIVPFPAGGYLLLLGHTHAAAQAHLTSTPA